MSVLLLPITAALQAQDKSCWACCTRTVIGHYKGAKFINDQFLAKAVGKKVNDFADIQPVLQHFGMFDDQEGDCFPEFVEIKEEIKKGSPLITCVVETKPTRRQKNFFEGHYVIIIGYDEKRPKKIAVMDPGDGQIHWVEYDKAKFNKPNFQLFWGVTYYTKSPTQNLP